MNVLAISKVQTTDLAYGNQQTFESLRFENVTKIEIVEVQDETFYYITHKTGTDAQAHTTPLSINTFTLMIC